MLMDARSKNAIGKRASCAGKVTLRFFRTACIAHSASKFNTRKNYALINGLLLYPGGYTAGQKRKNGWNNFYSQRIMDNCSYLVFRILKPDKDKKQWKSMKLKAN